jgi:hypothetical protein
LGFGIAFEALFDCSLDGDFLVSDTGVTEDIVRFDDVVDTGSGGEDTQIVEGSFSTTIFDSRAGAGNDTSESEVSEGILGIRGARLRTASKFWRWRCSAAGVLNLGDVRRPSECFDLDWASLGRSWDLCGEPLLASSWSTMVRARMG